MNFYSNFVEIVESGATQVYALCPFHKEKVPSFTINTETHQWFCHGCGEGGGYVSFLVKYLGLDKHDAIEIVENWKEDKGFPFPSEALVEEAHQCLKSNALALQLLHSWGVTDKIIEKEQIGFSNAEQRYYFPIRTKYGYLVNIRKYMPSEFREERSSAPKCIGMKGCNQSRFWPWSSFERGNTIFIVEGEKDCLAAISQGLNAVTGTGGSTIPPEDYSIFRGKKVYVMTDNDDAGDKIAQKYVDVISGQTNDIKRIKLPVKDFTDYYLRYGDANVMQYASAAIYDVASEEIQARKMTLTENESVDSMGERVLLENMIVTGSDPKTYAIPSVVCIRCNNEECKKPCKLYGGKTSLELAFEDRDLIYMIDSSDKKVYDLATHACGCKRVSIVPTKYTNAQRIVFQEKASLLGGLDDSSFEPRYGFYMYDKERLAPTAKYLFDATKVTDPRTQKVYYSIKNAKVDQTKFDEVVDYEYFRNIAKKFNNVIDFLQWHYDNWLVDCMVYGRLDVFSAMLLTMCSVTEIPYKSGAIKGTLDTMAIGDTRTGKSLLAQNLLAKLNIGGYINGENAKLTGVLGGVVRLGESWLITWGAIPLNDKGFLVVDEATGLSVEDITQLSSVRSGCVATINKVVRGEARARTRLLWIANPRSGKNINEYFWKGFGAFREFIPVNEDQARYDLLVGASRDDIDTIIDVKGEKLKEEVIRKYQNLIKYAWAIDPDEIKEVDYAYLRQVTEKLCNKYRGGTLLIKEAAYEKILRVAAALSVLTCSIENSQLKITNKMLDWASDYLSYLFQRTSVDYAYYVEKVQEEERLMKENTEYAIAICNQYPALRVLLNNTKFKGTQMAEVLGLDRDAVSKLLSNLLMRGLIKMTTGGLYTPSVNLINIIRKLNGGNYE